MDVNELITKADLLQTKADILAAIGEAMNRGVHRPEWLKSKEVMKMLGLSSSGLQNLRINATIPFTKLGGQIYYKYDDISHILESNKRNSA
jgi:helix-turn-helix protein